MLIDLAIASNHIIDCQGALGDRFPKCAYKQTYDKELNSNSRGSDMDTTANNLLDSETFERLYKSHIRAVETIVRKFRFQDAAADDLVQDVFVRAWTKRGNLRDQAAFSGWLMQIARNTCLNACKVQKNFVSISATDHTDEDETSQVVLAAEDKSESLELEFSLALIRQAIECHKHAARAEIARYFYSEEKTVEEISVLLNMKSNTVLSHLHRFRLVVAKAVSALIQNNDIEFASTRQKLLRA